MERTANKKRKHSAATRWSTPTTKRVWLQKWRFLKTSPPHVNNFLLPLQVIKIPTELCKRYKAREA